jgi:hypothetical protein
MSNTKKVCITNCAIAGITKFCFMTGVKHTDGNGTRYELITYNSIRDKVQQLWLSDFCFNVIGDHDED